FPNCVLAADRLKILTHCRVDGLPPKSGAVADDNQLASRAREGHIHAARVGEKSDLAFTVRTTSEITTASLSRSWNPSTVSISRAASGAFSRSQRTCAA